MAKRTRGGRHAHTVDHLNEMESFDRELMRATQEHIMGVLLIAAGIMVVLSAFVFSVATYLTEDRGVASLIATVLLAVAGVVALLSVAPVRRIRKIDDKELEGSEEFFNALRGGADSRLR